MKDKAKKIDPKKFQKLFREAAADLDKRREEEKQARLKYEREHCTCCPVHPRHDFKIGGH